MMIIYESPTSTIQILCSHEKQVFVLKTQASASAARNEIEFLSALDHPNIVPLLSWKSCGGFKTKLMMPYFINGDLFDAIHKWPHKMPGVEKIVGQLVGAVSYMHARGIAHRDLKPENVVFDAQHDLVLIDFELAVQVRREGEARRWRGTREYAPPEALDSPLDPFKQDVWCLGLILHEILFKTIAVSDLHVENAFLKRALEPDPGRRATVFELATLGAGAGAFSASAGS